MRAVKDWALVVFLLSSVAVSFYLLATSGIR